MAASIGRLKHLWMQGVLEDSELTAGQARVLVRCGLVSLEPGGDKFSVRQETVAEKLGVNINTVQAAFRRGKELGWIRLYAERQRGRGWHGGDTYRITIPVAKLTPAHGFTDEEIRPASVEEEIPPAEYGYSYGNPSDEQEIPLKSRVEYPQQASGIREKYHQKSDEIPLVAEAATSENGDLQGVDTGCSYKQGFKSQGIARENQDPWGDSDPLVDGNAAPRESMTASASYEAGIQSPLVAVIDGGVSGKGTLSVRADRSAESQETHIQEMEARLRELFPDQFGEAGDLA
jgi:hypothetical protein